LKIDSQHPVIPVSQPQQEPPGKVQGPTRGNAGTTDPAVLTHLHNGAADAEQDIDAAKVAEVRDAIREGKLELHPERIAEGLLASVHDLLGR
jgi:negative regulator of flagellin synthesis FlgM